MSKFSKGEVATIIYAANNPHVIGMDCLVVSDLRECFTKEHPDGFMGYAVEIGGLFGKKLAKPEFLRKRKPPSTPSSWEDMKEIWNPNKELIT